ncbi:hypothetical protein HPP92_005246 [Vanilla planifolia]|uniref:Transmembrane protein n=1 Tax=Vanilla planifolia TaxID=51239 RepID=A0A835RZ49_VANPL|nr:hypothetical protein HPP92_005246 [Vanilla planifolia]
MEDAREARRKRLAERRTDRLAFITGQSQSLGQPAPHDVPQTPTKEAFDDGTAAASETIGHSSADVASNVADIIYREELTFQQSEERPNPQMISNFTLTNRENESVEQPKSNVEDISGRLFTTSLFQRSGTHNGPRATNATSPSTRLTLFTPTEIGHSVLATENLRLVTAFVVALLVVLSYRDVLVGGGRLISIICFRPLVVVLLTDAAVILGWVLLNQGINQSNEKDVRNTSQEGEGWPNELGKIFEVGQMLLKVLGAAFMDCSICAVIMICGFVV